MRISPTALRTPGMSASSSDTNSRTCARQWSLSLIAAAPPAPYRVGRRSGADVLAVPLVDVRDTLEDVGDVRPDVEQRVGQVRRGRGGLLGQGVLQLGRTVEILAGEHLRELVAGLGEQVRLVL